MYITNADDIPKEREYLCNKTVARFLIYKQHIPLLSVKGKIWYFAKTNALEKALEEYRKFCENSFEEKGGT